MCLRLPRPSGFRGVEARRVMRNAMMALHENSGFSNAARLIVAPPWCGLGCDPQHR
jgi:hypothetical protein